MGQTHTEKKMSVFTMYIKILGSLKNIKKDLQLKSFQYS